MSVKIFTACCMESIFLSNNYNCIQDEAGSEVLLTNAESYGQYFANALMSENVNISDVISEALAIKRQNIGNTNPIFEIPYNQSFSKCALMKLLVDSSFAISTPIFSHMTRLNYLNYQSISGQNHHTKSYVEYFKKAIVIPLV